MAGKRTDKVAKQIQKDLGEILDEMKKSHFRGSWVTVMETAVSPDLGLVKVYVGIMPVSGAKKEEIFELLDLNMTEIRRKLAQRVKHQLRIVPEIAFYLDETLDRAQRLEALFSHLRDQDNEA